MDLDIAISGDAIGLAMSGISGWKTQDELSDDGTYNQHTVPIVETDFAMRIKAKPNDEIPLFRVRKLILDLINIGYYIVLFSADLKLASADTFQLLSRKGINTKYVSLDRTPKYHNDFKTIMLEDRWTTPWNNYLYFELKHLEWNRDSNKVDHPDEVKEIRIDDNGVEHDLIFIGSKDVSDGVIGSVGGALELASKHVDSHATAEIAKKTLENIAEDKNDFSWLLGIDQKHPRSKPQPEKVDNNKSATSMFLDILKKSQ